MKIETLKLKDLTPYEKNAKEHPQKQVEQIKESIQRFGMNDPIAVWGKKNIIVEGHGRFLACKELGIEEVPCIRLDHMTDVERREYTLIHNKTTMNSGFIDEILEDELREIMALDGDINLADFDFKAPQVELENLKEDNFEVKEPKEPKAQYGDIYQLGNHRLMCGDSTKKEDMEQLMDGELADLIMTDPPYNVNYEGEAGKIMNDHMEDESFVQFLTKAFRTMNDALRAGGVWYIWHASLPQGQFTRALVNCGMTYRQILIWNKDTFTLGRQDYQWKHEPCFYGWKEGKAHYFVNDRTLSSVIEEKAKKLDGMKTPELKAYIKELLNNQTIPTDVINEEKPQRNDKHPTMKPIKLLGRLILNSSKKNDIVLDPFGGSGSTLITCEQLNRRGYSMELDPKFVDVIIERWEEFTGQKAIKL